MSSYLVLSWWPMPEAFLILSSSPWVAGLEILLALRVAEDWA